MMWTKRVTVPLVVFLLLADAQAFAAAPIQGDLTWSELSARLTPRHGVRMVLPDGATIEAKLVRVTADAMVLAITKTSNRSEHPKGEASVPRASVSTIEVRSPGWKWRVIGALIPVGIGFGITAGALHAGNGELEPAIGGVAGLTIMAGAPLGYFAGRSKDRRFRMVRVIREAAKPAQ